MRVFGALDIELTLDERETLDSLSAWSAPQTEFLQSVSHSVPHMAEFDVCGFPDMHRVCSMWVFGPPVSLSHLGS